MVVIIYMSLLYNSSHFIIYLYQTLITFFFLSLFVSFSFLFRVCLGPCVNLCHLADLYN